MNSNHDITKYLSHAKINFGLQIINKRIDHYHNLKSYFIEINLTDTLSFCPSLAFDLTVDGINVPTDESNLIYQAYNMIIKKNKSKKTAYTIHLNKKIPIGGGLGGGSSNAATTIIALNQLWGLNLTKYEMEKLGASIGADVPFFIRGGTQFVEDIGTKLTPIKNNPLTKYYFVLIIPKIHISTAWAYNKLNKSLQYINEEHKFPTLSEPMKWELFENDFERVIHKTYPEIGTIKKILLQAGALYSSLSGSGSTVFGVFDNRQKAIDILNKLSQYQAYLTSPVIY